MYRPIVFSLLLVSVTASVRRHSPNRPVFPNGKIVGGEPITIDQRPFQVALEDRGFLFCGGSIIAENYVLTAAHCTDGSAAEYITVRYGTDQLQNGGQIIGVSKIFQNPNFTQVTLDYDISVLKLDGIINISNKTQVVTLSNQEPAAGRVATVSGWGTPKEGQGEFQTNLHSVDLPIVAHNTCLIAYGGEFTIRMICAGDADRDSCQGDAGGPLTVENKQVGIVSWGYGCAEAGFPGIYANVVALKDFIDQSSDNAASWD